MRIPTKYMRLPPPPLTSLTATIGLLLGVTPLCAQMTYTRGDLILGFQAAAGDGSGSTYVYNLGASTGFRNGTSTGQIANLKADLDGLFGEGWFSRNDVYWGIAGVRDPSGSGSVSVVNGDPRATIYISRPAAVPGSSIPWDLAPSSATDSAETISVANAISSMQGGFVTITGETVVTPENRRSPIAGSGGRAAIQATGQNNTWEEYNPLNESANGPAFGGFLIGGVQARLGAPAASSHLDLYRLLGRSSASATPNTPVGDGLLVGTFSLNAAGIVSFSAPSTASAYDTWADSFALTGGDRAGNADPDKDGVLNKVEFVVGGNPKTLEDSAKLPTVTVAAGFVDFVFRRTDVSSYLNPRAEYDTDLIGPWTPAVNGTAGVVITTQDDGFGAGIDRITVRIPVSGPTLFVRLFASQ